MRSQAIAVSDPVAGVLRRAVVRWYYVGVALLMLFFNVFAFAPSLVDASGRNVPLPLTSLVLLHTIVSMGWLLLFLAQVTLAAASRVHIHRRVGVFGAALAVAFVVLASLVVIAQARRGFDLGGDTGRLPIPQGVDLLSATVGFLFFPFQFAALVGAALWYRKRSAVHKRLMLIAVLGTLTPTPIAHMVGHWIGPQQWANVFFPVGVFLFLSLLALHDRLAEGRVHPVTLWIGALVWATNGLFTTFVQPTDVWRAFSMWLVE